MRLRVVVARLVVFWLGVALPALFVSSTVSAHTLGIDKADLVELADARYQLTSRVPRSIAPAITAPNLPSHCRLEGNPRGERGDYEVRFSFQCERALTAADFLVLPWDREGVLLTVRWDDGVKITRLVSRVGPEITIDLAEFAAGSGSWLATARRYTALGIEHILLGIDHLLFVLCLLLIVNSGRMLLKTITAFTVAHSITLALATFGLVNIPVSPVEAAIALSIVFLALEIVRAQQGRFSLTHRQPWLVSFGFGLLHGLGFASALGAIGLPQTEIPIALLFFNVGVEIGQLAFVVVVIGLIWGTVKLMPEVPRWARLTPVYAIGTTATYWFAERFLGIFS